MPDRITQCLAAAAAGASPYLAPILLAVVLAVGPASAQEAETAGDDVVVASVNGAPITYTDLMIAEEEMGAALAQVPDNVRFQYLLSTLIDRQILAQEAAKAGLSDDPRVKRREAYYDMKALRDVYWAERLQNEIKASEIRTVYNENFANAQPEREIRASHILVPSEKAANEVIARLDGGEDFAAVAEEVSVGPSKADGGDLGFFTEGDMVPEFSEAAFALKPGEISKPVKSQFGWHVIEVTDEREVPPPSYEDMEGQIRARLAQEKSEALLEDIREGATIEFPPAPGELSTPGIE